ncbi:hypothetical protein [Herminiimonas fonticola]|uniref:Uncharacterized protein n=1 Tax=Herminiimonas fonticola TaxID=303380 RepID=A0A4V3BUP0_9BURK|nr:hypothetical protein [Herminiimonas fonticola]RBA24364.1 hypothetical protein Hfont_2176 [Herminiimonas fonticola]TDN87308.1 hypothetical protein EV677_3019 [Herminiimonas fonticola]
MGRKTQINFLHTIFPPFTNRNVELLVSKANQHIAQHLRQSKFYMIAARAQASFVNQRIDLENATISLDVQVGTEVVDTGVIHVSKFNELQENCTIKITEEAVLLGGTKKGTHAKVWLTPDSVYWHVARHSPYLEGFTRHDRVCNYDLLYVGIAKQQDSYQRLIKNAHHGRLRVLSEEHSRKPGAHPSDEITLFLFDIEPFGIQTMSAEDDDYDFFREAPPDKVVADAEKAFVSLLDPHYNVTKFRNYPKGNDGLYGAGLNGYGYIINENFRFNTATALFKGFRSEAGFDNRQDSIYVEGDEVNLILSNEIESIFSYK